MNEEDDIPCDAEGRPLRFWYWTSGIGEEEDYELALKFIEKMFDLEPAVRSPWGDMFTYWADEVKRFEDKRWPIDRPDP